MSVVSVKEILPEKSKASSGKTPVIRATDMGVKYVVGNKRDDLKSIFLDNILGRRQKKEIWALRNVSFECHKGEILGIIGSNGAGKTTMCRVISDILRPDEGKLIVRGKVSALLSLGVGFNSILTGRENIYLNSLMLGISRKEADSIIPKIIEMSELADFIDEPIKKYSKGMKARLGFSIASAIEPEILVLDEIFSAGDHKFTMIAEERIGKLIKKTKAVVIVSHSLELIKRQTTKALWIEKGKAMFFGKPEDVVGMYNEFILERASRGKKAAVYKKTKPIISKRRVLNAENIGVKYFLKSNRRNPNASRMVSLIPKRHVLWALKDVDLNIKKGEIVGIIGSNGAGKTTLCKTLSGIIMPDEGDLQVKSKTNALLGFGTGFNVQLSGKDNIFLNGLLMGIPMHVLRKVYKKIVDFSELQKFIDQPVKNYSAGMKARLGFSIASMINPELLIIDEALSAGDASFQEKVSAKIQELIHSSDAVILVSHNMDFIENVCTRAIWIDKGKVVMNDSPDVVIKSYTNK